VAGLAGLIKAVLTLEHGSIPANLHFRNPNPRVPFEDWRLKVPTEQTLWPGEGPRRISINSFGFGGANAHTVLDDAYHYIIQRGVGASHRTTVASVVTNALSNGFPNGLNGSLDREGKMHGDSGAVYTKTMPFMLVLSANDREGLARQRLALLDYLQERRDVQLLYQTAFLRDLAFTLGQKRTRLPWKIFHTASTIADLTEHLKSNSQPAMRSSSAPRVAFVFTGQGAQWARMGIELLEYRIFRESVEAADSYLTQIGCPWSAIEELGLDDESSNINHPFYSQTLCTVLQVAVVQLLRSWNITPDSVVGHSSGEIAAAYSMGAISRQDAWHIAFWRGKLSATLTTMVPRMRGAMLAVGASPEQTKTWIAKFVTRGECGIACINSPSSVTVSGDAEAIDELAASLKEQGTFARKLKVSTAYHSHHMKAIEAAYLDALRDIKPNGVPAGGPRMFTSVTGSAIEPEHLGASHWVTNLVSPVLFSDAVHELARPKGPEQTADVELMIEIGPHAALQGPVGQVLKSSGFQNVEYRSVISRGRNAVDSILAAVGEMIIMNVPVDMAALNHDADPQRLSGNPPTLLVDLPPYAWNHTKTYWNESRINKQIRERPFPRLGLVGAPQPSLGQSDHHWRGFLRIADQSWIADHRIHSSILYPASGFIGMAIEAAHQVADDSRAVRQFRLREVEFTSAVTLTDDSNVECIIQMRPHATGMRDLDGAWFEFSVHTSVSRDDDLRRNCSGLLLIEYEAAENSSLAYENGCEEQMSRTMCAEAEKACTINLDCDTFYKELASVGLKYGSTFQGMRQGWHDANGRSHGIVQVVDDISMPVAQCQTRPHIIHPTMLDTICHAAFLALRGEHGLLREALVVKSIDGIAVAARVPFKAASSFKFCARASRHGFGEITSDVHMLDESAGFAVSVKNLTFVKAGKSEGTAQGTAVDKNLASKIVWRPAINMLSPAEQQDLLEKAHRQSDNDIQSALHEEQAACSAILNAIRDAKSIPNIRLRNVSRWMDQQLQVLPYARDADNFQSNGDLQGRVSSFLTGKAPAESLLGGASSVGDFFRSIRGIDTAQNRLGTVSDPHASSLPISLPNSPVASKSNGPLQARSDDTRDRCSCCRNGPFRSQCRLPAWCGTVHIWFLQCRTSHSTAKAQFLPHPDP
jgi:acyl transferase domain-containing protein